MINIGRRLVVSWQESVEFLKPKTLRLFLLLALRSLKELYFSLLFAWFIPIALFAGLVLNLKSLMYAFYMVLLVRGTRPSIEKKGIAYWQEVHVVDWVLFLGLLFLLEVPVVASSWLHWTVPMVYNFLLSVFFLAGHAWLPGAEALGAAAIFLSPFVVVWTLFMCDAQKTPWQYIKAFGRALTMLVYNYPFFLVVYEIIRLTLAGIYLVSRFVITAYPPLGIVGWVLLLAFFLPLYVCFITNVYVKRLHDQMSLYYKV